jgi:hypothetical protein
MHRQVVLDVGQRVIGADQLAEPLEEWKCERATIAGRGGLRDHRQRPMKIPVGQFSRDRDSNYVPSGA